MHAELINRILAIGGMRHRGYEGDTEGRARRVYVCVCLSHRKQGQDTHAVSPPVTAFYSALPVFTSYFSLPPSVKPLPMSCARLLPSSPSLTPTPTWPAC